MTPKIIILDKAYHRNGIFGAPFWLVRFREEGETGEHAALVAVLFREQFHCAVFNPRLAADGIIAFGVNSYRGDEYERVLRPIVWPEGVEISVATTDTQQKPPLYHSLNGEKS